MSGPDLLVTLIEGRLRIVPQPRADHDPRRVREIAMTAGQQLDVATAQPPVLRNVETARAVAWERGQIDFVNETLESVVRRVNHYSTRQIIIADPAVATMQLSGVVDAAKLMCQSSNAHTVAVRGSGHSGESGGRGCAGVGSGI